MTYIYYIMRVCHINLKWSNNHKENYTRFHKFTVKFVRNYKNHRLRSRLFTREINVCDKAQ